MPDSPQTAPQTWSLSEIVQHTGLPVGLVQQAMKEGYVTPAAKHRYLPGAVFRGLIRYLHGKVNQLPSYDNIAQASAATGIPVAVIKRIRRAAPDAFRNKRVHLAALLKGIFEGSDQKDWADTLRMANAKIRLIDLNKAEDKTLDKAEVNAAISRAVSGFFFDADRMAELELPPELKGLDEQQIRLRIVEALRKLKLTMIERLKGYIQEENQKS